MALLNKLTVAYLLKQFSSSVGPAIESYRESIQPITSQPVSLMSILILSFHQHLNLVALVYLSGLLAKLPCMLHALHIPLSLI
jgi:hypothetical protein